jgi:hypothetical protein
MLNILDPMCEYLQQKNESFMNYQIRVLTLYYFTFLMHYTRVDEQNIVVPRPKGTALIRLVNWSPQQRPPLLSG